MIPALYRIFNPDRLEAIDPNKPENEPLARAEAALINQAYVQWYEGPGHYAIASLEKALMGKIIAAIGHPRYTTEDRNKNLAILDEIKRDARVIDTMVFSFDEEEKRRAKENLG